MRQNVETVIIGGGQAGLSTSYYLSQRGHPHVVLEQAARAGNAWRNDRWDSFTLLTPNWSFRLPGAEYQGSSPEGFMARDEIVASFERYVERYHLPVHYGQPASRVEPSEQGYLVTTAQGMLRARNVVIATGLFQRPKIPAMGGALPPSIAQLHSGHYRNPAALAPGAVLVVGSGQSGSQIAEELYLSGRKVYLCIGSAGRVPRRYRGKDVFEWLELCGFLDRTVEDLPSPQARFYANPHLSGRDGGRTLNLHQFARDGVSLLGRLEGIRDHTIYLASDMKESLAKADALEVQITEMIDGYIARAGLDAPPETLPALRDGFAAPEIASLDLASAGITAVIWAIGYSFDFGLVKLPVLDGAGYPIQRRGATRFPGLYFVGMPWLTKQKSGLLLGVGEDAAHIAATIAGKPIQKLDARPDRA